MHSLPRGTVINGLGTKSGGSFTNFRDSELTKFLKDSLTGNSKVRTGPICPPCGRGRVPLWDRPLG
jgi:hypothetical protein